MKLVYARNAATSLIMFTLLGGVIGQSNHIIKEAGVSASQASSSSSTEELEALATPVKPAPAPPAASPPGVGVGFGKGAGFHKSLDLNIGAGAGAGYGPLLAGLLPQLYAAGAGAPPPDVPPPAAPGFDPLLGGPGYMGFPGFTGPSYIPYSWLGSALGAKGDLLFPIVIFVFVVVGTWTVVKFLLGLIVPLIAGKLAVGKSILAAKGFHKRAIPDPWDEREEQLNKATEDVMPALDKYASQYGAPPVASQQDDDDPAQLTPEVVAE